jgi:TolB protein
MRKLVTVCCFCFWGILFQPAFAMLNLELTRGVAGAVPIAVVPFAVEGDAPSQDVAAIISSDLQNSGRFKVYTGNALTMTPSTIRDVQFNYFRNRGADDVVIGKVQQVGGNRYQVSFQLLDAVKGKSSQLPEDSLLLGKKFTVPGNELRALAHHISDLIYQQITGVRGVFSTRLAYVVVQRAPQTPTRYVLEVADQDGYNPQPLLVSTDPVMSPAWSPDGKKIAYVSFEHRHAAIYVEDILNGARRLVSESPGINGAPAWSPDGRKLALVLSKSGSPNIYILNLATRQLTEVTHDWSINTEPAWSPDGKILIFTSNRGGNPQIYQKNLVTGAVSRVSYEGNYNARSSFTPDGNHIVLLNQQSRLFNVGILDLDNGYFRVLTNSGSDHDSPSIAPNGSMVLFGTVYNGRSVLGMVATDGSVQVRLPARNGEVQDPAWSPFLS